MRLPEAVRDLNSDPEICHISRGVYRISLNNYVVALSDADQHRRACVVLDGNKIGADNCKVMIINGKNESGVKRHINESKQIFFRPSIGLLVEH